MLLRGGRRSTCEVLRIHKSGRAPFVGYFSFCLAREPPAEVWVDFHPQTGALANRKSIVFPMSECLFLLATELSWDISATFQKTPSPVSQQAIWLTVEQLWCFFFFFFYDSHQHLSSSPQCRRGGGHHFVFFTPDNNRKCR